ncbi:MAG: T9SS type A sorting domain-containing protein [Bacteroidales bacterium]|jgi:hypothetical protein|nr:T9SS type A sorting domain-containing protein [Bacteroidales bacterium]MDD3527705.1 T9SS type A sorting domain-containing protein [Bacteroidales bacterium]NLO52765.1 T9SS type A sorting domain-containing protein [Bacteroidales bacterium]
MSIKILIYLAFFGVAIQTVAQNTFEFCFESDLRKSSSNAVTAENGDIITFISERDSINFHPSKPVKAYLLKFSPNGDTITKRYSFGDTLFSFINIFSIDKSDYLVIGYAAKEYPESIVSFVMKVDSTLQRIWIKYYVFGGSTHFRFRRVFEMNQNHYVLAGELSETPFQGSHPFFLRMDDQGNLMDSTKYYGDTFLGSDILLSPDSSQFWFISPTGLDPLGWASIAVFDTSFTFISIELMPGGGNLHIPTAMWHQDNKFLVGFKGQRPGVPYQDDEIRIIQVDTGLNLLNQNYFGAPDTTDYPCHFEQTIDFCHPDSIYFAGFKNNKIGVPTPDRVSWIMVGQADSLLQPRFLHYIGGDAYYEAYYIIATRDGGCFVCAGKWSPEKYVYDLVFLKLNNEGLIVGDHPPGIAVKKALVYPNPVTDKIQVETALRNATLDIYNISGVLKSSHDLNGTSTTIDLGCFAPGTYIYTITNNDGQVENGKFIKQ